MQVVYFLGSRRAASSESSSIIDEPGVLDQRENGNQFDQGYLSFLPLVRQLLVQLLVSYKPP